MVETGPGSGDMEDQVSTTGHSALGQPTTMYLVLGYAVSRLRPHVAEWMHARDPRAAMLMYLPLQF